MRALGVLIICLLAVGIIALGLAFYLGYALYQ